MKLTVMGTGYVGIVTAVGFANLGNDVTGCDIDPERIATLSEGRVPIFEPGLEELFARQLAGGRLRFTTDTAEAVSQAEVIFICVGTPTAVDRAADLSAVEAVARAIGRYMDAYAVVVTKSTVPVGTAGRVTAWIREEQSRPIPFDVVSNPEFLREGAAVKDFENPDRIVIGTSSPEAQAVMERLYRSLARTSRPIMVTDVPSAELIKYASNAMLATRISFMNQLAGLCEKTGADIKAVARGLGLDSRIGARFLHAGLGYGGSCFPKDVKALIATLHQHDCPADLFEAVDRINERQKSVAVDKLRRLMDPHGKTVALWGLSFKPKTDDIREAPALEIVRQVQALGAAVQAYDPVAMPRARQVLSGVRFFDNPYETIRDCDALIVATEWDEFRNLDMRAVQVLLRGDLVIDGRNIYDPEEMRRLGFTYVGIGR